MLKSKECTTCCKAKPLTEFTAMGGKRRSARAECKVCRNEREKLRYETAPDVQITRVLRQYRANPHRQWFYRQFRKLAAE